LSIDARTNPTVPTLAECGSDIRATANTQSPSRALSNISRYRCSKIYNGNPPCGNKVQSGNTITPHFLGRFIPVMPTT
ncbi:MAG: hypothetical protein ACK46A_09960, partial [Akkermansiaceae bacterium]